MAKKTKSTRTAATSRAIAEKTSRRETTVTTNESNFQAAPVQDKLPSGSVETVSSKGQMMAPKNGVRVRMYRQGLGDCFLLAFPGANGEMFYMMIDCGVILGTENPAVLMQGVMNDIATATGGRVNVIAVTHEHWDHVSGFVQAKSVFGPKVVVDNVWLAWTEDSANRLAQQLRSERQHKEQAMRAVARRMHAAGLVSAAGVAELLTFFGDGFAAASGQSTSNALNNVRSFSKTQPRFCKPADPPIELKEVPGVRFYVLGPPEDEKLLRRSDPSQAGETYGMRGVALNSETAFLAAAAADAPGDSPYKDPALQELSLPFDKVHQIPPDEAKQQTFFRERYYAEGDNYRHIDDDWLENAGQLALQLDSDTNNTSLVLAVELVPSGKVLLFAADAQVGNWLSWDNQTWSVLDTSGNQQQVTAADLLKRTVLYKVGHHGSHNATLREKGLERMLSPDLVAMIPVNHDMAVKKRWNMPFPPLLDRLKQKTSSRVIRIDDTTPVKDQPAPTGVTPGLWNAFKASLSKTQLYFEFTVGG